MMSRAPCWQRVAAALVAVGVWTAAAAPARAQSLTSTPQPTPTATPDRRSGDGPGYWRSNRDGWFWYQDPPPAPVAPATPAASAPGEPLAATPATLAPEPGFPTSQDRDVAAHKAFQVKLERSLNAAVANPSEANLQSFLELWAEARRKASVFTDTAQVLAARMPWVDETAQGTRPPNPAALRVFDQVQADEKDQLMRRLASSHGLYFFFRGDCAYCHAHAPLLKQFEQKFGFTVFAVSLDGQGVPHYPRPVRDNGLLQRVAETLHIPPQHLQVPFTVLANPRTREVLPVGFGPMTSDEMVDRITLLLRGSSAVARTGPPPANSVMGSPALELATLAPVVPQSGALP